MGRQHSVVHCAKLGSRGPVDYVALLSALFGIGLLSSGIATLNQYAERDLDGLMRRTANRPLPAGKLAPWEALAFGSATTVIAETYLLVFVNPLTALLGLAVIAGYIFAYTPLKTRTSLSTLVGASQSVLVENGKLVLGTWQAIYLCEFDGPRSRNVLMRIMAE